MEPYLPSNGTERMQFYDNWCDRCQNPAELAWVNDDIPPGCPYIVQAMAMNEQPEVWVIKDGEACCTAFEE